MNCPLGISITNLSAATTASEFALNWLVQSTLLIATGLLLAHWLRPKGSATQSLIYRTTLAAVLICPLATFTLDQLGVTGWSIRLPEVVLLPTVDVIPEPDARPSSPPASLLENRLPSAGESPGEFSNHPIVEHSDSAYAPLLDPDVQPPHAFDDPPRDASSDPIVAENSAATANGQSSDVVPVSAGNWAWLGLLTLCIAVGWIFTTAILLMRLATAWWRLSRLVRAAHPADAATLKRCEKIAKSLGVATPQVLRSPFLTSPCLTGLGLTSRAIVLLPENQLQLPLQDVLVHELAHLRRHDVHWNLLRQIATAFYFFQPLLWVLSRRIEFTAEEVCDDYVVQFGGDRERYATQLVDIAELSTAVSAAAVAAAGVGIISLRSMLARRVERIMDSSRELSTRVGSLLLLLILIIGLASTAVVGLVGLNNASTLANEPAIAEVSDEEAPVEESADGEASSELPIVQLTQADAISATATTQTSPATRTRIRGIVIDEQNQPMAGVTIKAIRSQSVPYQYDTYQYDTLATTQTDELGKFEIDVPDQSESTVTALDKWRTTDLIATARGYGIKWKNLADAFDDDEDDRPLRIRLNGSPSSLEGKLLWPDGTPAAGVEVAVHQLTDKVTQDVMTWMTDETAAQPVHIYLQKAGRLLGKQHPGLPAKTRTDQLGRFKVAGINALHNATIGFTGQDVMHETVNVINHRMRPFQSSGKQYFYGNGFTHTVTRGITIEGNVVDAETEKPIAGVKVAPSIFHTNGSGVELPVRTATDAAGHFRVEGFPPTTKNYLRLIPTKDQPYLVARDLEVPKSDGQKPLSMNVQLRRGVFVRGRITDSANGTPVQASVSYLPYKSNENAKQYERFKTDKNRMITHGEINTNENGEFQVVAIPGSGIIAASAQRPQDWQAGFGAEAISIFEGHNRALDTYDYCVPVSYNGLAEVDIPAGVAEFSQGLQFDRGAIVRLRPLDHQGNPIDNVRVISLSRGSNEVNASPIEIRALRPDEKRYVILRHEERDLACFATVQAPDETAAESTVHDVKLAPHAVVTGKLVDKNGKPIEGLRLHANGSYTSGWISTVESATTRKDGTFEFKQLVGDGTYQITATGAHGYTTPQSFKLADNLKLSAGEKVDLGTIDKSRQDRPEPRRTASADPAVRELASVDQRHDNRISGVVLGADGKSVAGAKIYWMSSRSYALESVPPQVVATTNDEGEFTFVKPALKLDPDAPATWGYLDYLVVRAPGHGFSVERPGNLLKKCQSQQKIVGLDAGTSRASKGAIVKLPAAGKPLRGRIVDVDGAGVADAAVRIRWFHDLGQFANDANQERGPADVIDEQWRKHIRSLAGRVEPPQAIDVFPLAKTDSEGQFELKDAGANRIFQLIIAGERIETAELIAHNQPGKIITVTSDYPSSNSKHVVHPQTFLHVAGPSVPVEGQVVDFDTGEPISGALVRANGVHGSDRAISNQDRQFSTHSDRDGNYRITGLPVGSDNRLICICRQGEIPYPNMGIKADTSKSQDVLKRNIRMKRGVWAEGRVFDADTKKPMVGSISYYFFRNPELLGELPGLRYTHIQWDSWTNRDGYFRVPVLPTRGILAYEHHPISHEEAMQPTIDRYPRGQGAESIKGKEEGMNAFSTYPTYLMAENYQRLIEINPDGSQDSVNADIATVASRRVFARPAWPADVSANNYHVYGITQWGWKTVTTPEFEIKGIKPGEDRKVFVYHRESDLVGTVTISASDNAASPANATTIEVQPAGTIIGRLLDADGEPMPDATLSWDYNSASDPDTGVWAPDPGKRTNPSVNEIENDGSFRLTGIVPGMNYTGSASANRKMFTTRMTPTHIGNPFTDVRVKAGETKDLGDLRADVRGVFPPGDADERQTLNNKEKTKKEKLISAVQRESEAPSESPIKQPAENPEPAAEPKVMEYAGQVVDPDGKPKEKENTKKRNAFPKNADTRPVSTTWKKDNKDTVAGTVFATRVQLPNGQPATDTHVALVGVSIVRSKMEILAEHVTDAEGCCRIELPDVHSATHNATQLFARKDGYAVGWQDVTTGSTAEVSIDLAEEQTIRGRLFNIEGEPVGGERLSVISVRKTRKEPQWVDGDGTWYRTTGKQPQAWVPSVVADEDGRFEIHGVPRGYGVSASLIESQNFGPQSIAINTGESEQRSKSDQTYRSLVENTPDGEEVTITLSPPQIITGKITAEDTGEPIANARVSIWASQQKQFGSMVSVEGETDENGTYRILPYPGIRFGISAFPPKGSPYLSCEAEVIKWEDGDQSRNVDVALQRGVLIRGRILEEGTDKPVAKAGVIYQPLKYKTVPKNVITGWQNRRKTDDDGEFSFAVPRGAGILQVKHWENTYANQSRIHSGRRQYAHAFYKVEPTDDSDTLKTEIRLRPGSSIHGQVVDESGAPVKKFQVITNLRIWDPTGNWRGDDNKEVNGKFQLKNLEAGKEYTMSVLDAKRLLGATVQVKAQDEPVKIVLKPCGKAIARFVLKGEDKERKVHPTLFFVMTPGCGKHDMEAMRSGETAADSDFVTNIDRLNYGFNDGPKMDEDGSFTFPALIPGATYRLFTKFDGSWSHKDFTVKSGQTLDLGEFHPEFED